MGIVNGPKKATIMAQNGVGFTRRILAMYKQIKALSNQIKAGKYAVIAGSLFCFYGLYAFQIQTLGTKKAPYRGFCRWLN